MIGYEESEIPAPRRNWVSWLRTFSVGEERVADLEDRNRIAASISANFKGTPYSFTTKKKDEFTLIIKRTD